MLDKSSRKWKELVTGRLPLQTDNLGLQLFLKRCATRFATPQPAGELEKAVQEIQQFFTKYERILSKEIALLSK